MYTLYVDYVYRLITDVPHLVYEGLLGFFFISILLLIVWKGFKKGFHYSIILILTEYVCLVFCSTVFFRVTKEIGEYNFYPFWSYKAIQEGKIDLLLENTMNVIVFIPVGFLLGVAFKKMTWWKTILIGGSVSITIETLQFIFHKGFSEIDDVIHNTMGCFIGYGMMKTIKSLYGYIID